MPPFQVLRVIGQGGFGIVEEVIDGATQEHYARKRFLVNQGPNFDPNMIPHVRQRFEREVHIQSGIDHRHIVPILGSDLAGTDPYFLMPVAENSLKKDLEKDKTLGGQGLRVIMDIIAGLEEMHSMDAYHRDLKPDNVLRFDDNGSPFWALGDFGFVSLHTTQLTVLTQTGMAMGTGMWTAPEIVQDLRLASAQSDIFSIGCILHDIVGTGRRVACQEIREGGDYGPIMLSCTRTDPSRRFKSVGDLRDALMEVNSGTITVLGEQATDIATLLSGSDELTEAEWSKVVDYLESEVDTRNGTAIFLKITLQHIEKLVSHPTYFAALGELYARWVRDRGFDFDTCDTIANRLIAFINHGGKSLQADCTMSLLYMGTSHNRWYVERRFVELVKPSIDDDLAKRIAVEMRADSYKACNAITHLEQSIRISRSTFHPRLVATLQQQCP